MQWYVCMYVCVTVHNHSPVGERAGRTRHEAAGEDRGGTAEASVGGQADSSHGSGQDVRNCSQAARTEYAKAYSGAAVAVAETGTSIAVAGTILEVPEGSDASSAAAVWTVAEVATWTRTIGEQGRRAQAVAHSRRTTEEGAEGGPVPAMVGEEV